MSASDGSSGEIEALRARVTELEARLSDSSHPLHLHSVFDHLFEGIQILDPDFRYVYLNETAARHGRRERDELIGRLMVEMYPGIEETDVFRSMRACMAEQAPRQMVNRFTYPGGRSAWFELRMNPVPMGILILSIDVTEQKDTEELLQRERADLAATLECMADAIVATDLDGRVTRMNPSAESLTGWSLDESVGKSFSDLVQFLNETTGAPVERLLERVKAGGVKIGLANHTLLVPRDGSTVPVASSAAPIRNEAGKLRGVVIALRDMRDEHELLSMLQQAQKMEAMGALAGGVAHDFNNVLTVISGHIGLAQMRAGDVPNLSVHLDEIDRAAARAATLTRQLLAFSRKQELKPTILDFNSVVADMDRLLRRVLGENVALVTKLQMGLHPVSFDPSQIEQIIMNLALNARDAMPRGGTLTIETRDAVLDEAYVHAHEGSRPGSHVMLAVTDTGTGMDAATQRRIFEPFFTTKERGKGTGLGLSTVYGILRQVGGSIDVRSRIGVGTTFRAYVPTVSPD